MSSPCPGSGLEVSRRWGELLTVRTETDSCVPACLSPVPWTKPEPMERPKTIASKGATTRGPRREPSKNGVVEAASPAGAGRLASVAIRSEIVGHGVALPILTRSLDVRVEHVGQGSEGEREKQAYCEASRQEPGAGYQDGNACQDGQGREKGLKDATARTASGASWGEGRHGGRSVTRSRRQRPVPALAGRIGSTPHFEAQGDSP